MRLDPLQVKQLFRDLPSWDGERETPNQYILSLLIRQRLDLPLLIPPRGKWVLDAGCGEGRLSLEFLQHGAKCVCAIDLSANIMQRAKKNVTREGYDANFVRGDIERLPFSPELFDAVICIDTFVHLPDPKRAISELRRVAKKGGKIAVNMTNRNPFWCISVYGITNLSRFFKDLCLYYCPNLLIRPFLKLLRIVPFGKHLSEKAFRTLFKKDLAIVKFREYGLKPPAFFMAIAEKHSG